MSIPRGKKVSILLALIFLLGVVTRLLALEFFDVRDRYRYDSEGYLVVDGEHGDDREYEGRAWNLLNGRNFWALPNGDGSAPPGYPLLIAVLYSITGRNFLVPLWANAFFGGALSLAVFFLARRHLSIPYALLAAAGVAADPILIFWSARIMTETLAVLLALLCLLAMTRITRNQGFGWAVFCGVLAGVAILVRANLIVLPLAFIVWICLTHLAKLWRQTLTMALCTAVVVFSVTMVGVKNRPSRTESQWERAGGLITPDRYREVALHRAARQKGGSLTPEEEQRADQNAEAYIQSTPWWTVLPTIWAHNFSVFWQLTPSVGSTVTRLVYTGTTLTLILLGAIGAVSLLRTRSSREEAGLWLLVIAGLSGIHTVLISQPRYRLMVEPLLWILAISGGAALLHLGAGRNLKRAP